MDILGGLTVQLRFVERFYRIASEPFVTTKGKIENGAPPFEPPPFDPERDNPEPPFLEEWLEADECLNLVGQACLALAYVALRKYLDAFIVLTGKSLPSGKGSWFERYEQFFEKEYGIDWKDSPVPPSELEEINLARNDIQHPDGWRNAFDLRSYQSDSHHRRFPQGLFCDPWHSLMPSSPAQIYVSAASLSAAIQRIEAFCSFLDSKRPRWEP